MNEIFYDFFSTFSYSILLFFSFYNVWCVCVRVAIHIRHDYSFVIHAKMFYIIKISYSTLLYTT